MTETPGGGRGASTRPGLSSFHEGEKERKKERKRANKSLNKNEYNEREKEVLHKKEQKIKRKI